MLIRRRGNIGNMKDRPSSLSQRNRSFEILSRRRLVVVRSSFVDMGRRLGFEILDFSIKPCIFKGVDLICAFLHFTLINFTLLQLADSLSTLTKFINTLFNSSCRRDGVNKDSRLKAYKNCDLNK